MNKIVRKAPEHPLAQSRVTISTRHNDIRAILEELFHWVLPLGGMENSGECFDAVALQPRYDIVNPIMCRTAAGLILNDFDDDNFLKLVEKRQCIADGAPSFARVVPTDHSKLQL